MASSAELAIIIKARDEASQVFGRLDAEMGGFAKSASNVGRRATAAGATLTAGLTLPIVGLGAAVITTAAGLEQVLSEIKAVGGASEEETAALAKLGLQLGKDTAFSAKEAAEGMRELVKGGVSVADVLGGAAAAALNLAAAGGVEVAEAAAIAANAMALFGIEGKDAAHAMDMIAGFASATTGGVNDFKFALSMSGSAAKLAGQTFDDTAVALGLLGKAGILGSDAGTSLKTMLLNLQPETKKQVEAFRELGLDTGRLGNAFLDAEGNFLSLGEIAGLLNTATKDLSESERALALEAIFGSDAIRAAAIIAEAGAEGFDAMAESMGKVTAEVVATARLDNLLGKLEQLTGSLESAAAKLGERFLPGLKELADKATGLVNDVLFPMIDAFGKLPGPVQVGIVAFLGLLAAIGPLLVGLGFMASGLGALISLAPVMGAAFTIMLGPIGLIIAAIAALVAGVVILWNTNEDFRSFVTAAWETIQEGVGAAITWISDFLIPSFIAGIQALWADTQGLRDAMDAAWIIIRAAVSKAADIIGDHITAIVAAFRKTWEAAEGLRDVIGAVWDIISTVIGRHITAIVDAFGKVWTATQGIRDAFAKLGGDIIAGLVSGITSGLSKVTGGIKWLLDRLLEAAKDQLEIASASKVMMREVGVPIMEGILAGMQEAEPRVSGWLAGIPKQWIEAMTPGVRSAGESIGAEFMKGITAGIGTEASPAAPITATIGPSTAVARNWNLPVGHRTPADWARLAEERRIFFRTAQGLSLAHGGMVPGPIGAPLLATVHGGEKVIPAGAASPTINVHIDGNVYGVDHLHREIEDAIRSANIRVVGR